MNTNRDKFKEVFGFEPNEDDCIAPVYVCMANNSDCKGCPFKTWWGREYKGDKGSEAK